MWDRLKKETKPIVLYGTGNAAEKILKELDARGIRVSGIFASDGFVRDRSFAGFKVLSYEQARERFGDMCVLLCFGSHRPDVMENMLRINSEQDLYAPDLPIAGEGLFDEAYYNSRRGEFDGIRGLLADEQSRKAFDSIIDYKLTGRIEPLISCSTAEDENWRLLFQGGKDEKLSFMDLGAYTGDTAELFIRLCNGKYEKIIAVEPDKRNFRKLSENLGGLKDAVLINAAAGSEAGTALFARDAGRGVRNRVEFGEAGEPQGDSGRTHCREVSVRSVDEILGGDGVDIIKMDIEGEEAEAIEGASNTIAKHRPKMLIAAYHRREDLFDIPRRVLGIRDDYKLYLRKDPCIPAWGVNYYFL